MNSSTYEIVRTAIVNKQQVVATYRGRVRHMCPYTIGFTNGREIALFYQFGGMSGGGGEMTAGSSTNWRCIFLDELSNVSAQEGEWLNADDQSRAHSCVNTIDIEATS